VNAIKHKHRKLSSLHFHGIGLFCPGYFVEGVCGDGAIGPDPDVHKDANVAISFNRDLPFHIINLYYAAAVLGAEIQKLTRMPFQMQEESLNRSDEALAEVMRRLSILPRTYFPDEARMPVPLVEYRRVPSAVDFKILLELPAQRVKARSVPTGSSLQVSWSGDGISRTYKLPYWTKRSN
jgi:hypothetical protein